MNRKNIQLIALDLDGTLFNSQSAVSTENTDAIKQAADAGITVIISTGRPYIGLPLEFMAETDIHYAITGNGSSVYQIPGKKCLFSDCMDASNTADLLDELLRYEVHIDTFIDGEVFSDLSKRPLIDRLAMPEEMKHYIRTTRHVVDDLPARVRAMNIPVQKITLNFPPEQTDGKNARDLVAAYLSGFPQYRIVTGGYANLEITKADVSKAKGLQFLCDLLNIPIENSLVCGDNENDLDIVQAAGTGVAMANASDLLKSEADFITRSNDEDGVAYAIHSLCLNS